MTSRYLRRSSFILAYSMTVSLDRIPEPGSPLARRDARWLLATVLVAVVAFSGLHTVPAAAVAYVSTLAFAALGRIPGRWYVGRLGSLLPFFILFGLMLPFLIHDAEPWLQLG